MDIISVSTVKTRLRTSLCNFRCKYLRRYCHVLQVTGSVSLSHWASYAMAPIWFVATQHFWNAIVPHPSRVLFQIFSLHHCTFCSGFTFRLCAFYSALFGTIFISSTKSHISHSDYCYPISEYFTSILVVIQVSLTQYHNQKRHYLISTSN